MALHYVSISTVKRYCAHYREPDCVNHYAEFLLLLVLLTGLQTLVHADDSSLALVSESEFFAEVPSIASVTRLPQPRSETPAAVSVIDRDMIRASGARNLADLLRLVPGFQVAFPRAFRPTATYHGLGDDYARRMQILIDGRSIYNALFSQVSWFEQALSIDDIERIEVIRGPNAAAYGANAFLATVNIITRHPVQQQGLKVAFNNGNQGVGDIAVRYGGKLESAEYRISAGYLSDNGLANVPDDNSTGFLNSRIDLLLDSGDSLILEAGVSQAIGEEGYYNNELYPPTDKVSDSYFAQLRWLHQFSADNEISLQLYSNYRDVDLAKQTDPIDLGAPVGEVSIVVDLGNVDRSNDIEWQQSLRLHPDFRLVWGAGMHEDRVRSVPFFGDNNDIISQSRRLFTHTEWSATPALLINLGAMWEDHELTGRFVSPRLAINYHLDDQQTLRAAWSKAQRLPTLLEDYSQLNLSIPGLVLDQIHLGSGNLEAEVMNSFELGYLLELGAINARLDTRIYRDRISNLITEIEVPALDLFDQTALDSRNEGEFIVNGIDVEFDYRLSQDERIILSLAFMQASGSAAPADATTSERNRVASVPDYSGSVLLMHRFSQGWTGSLGYYFVDAMTWMGDGEALPATQRLDLRLSHTFRMGQQQGEAALVVQNLGDKIQDFAQDQYFEQRVFASMTLNW